MKKIAIYPFSKDFLNNEMFNLNSLLNRDNNLMCWVQIKDNLKNMGIELNTIDLYNDLNEVDCFLFCSFDPGWYYKIPKRKKCIYIAFEPEVVDYRHSKKNLTKMLRYFDIVLTWNDDIVDQNRIMKFMYPFYFEKKWKNLDATQYANMKLLTCISGNKKSKHPKELYSERLKVINYFDNNAKFSLYGVGWDAKEHPSYRGKVLDKTETYHKYKFALCLENERNVKGYITEKILDCFCAGIVPIYKGAENIGEYIPENCFINYDSFDSISEMEKYISNIDYEGYLKYRVAMNEFLESKKRQIFEAKNFTKAVCNAMQKKAMDYKCFGKNKLSKILMVIRSKMILVIRDIKNKL